MRITNQYITSTSSKMIPLCLSLIIFLLPTIAYSHDPLLIQTKAGIFVLNTDEAGTPTISPYPGKVINLDGETPTDPTDPNPPLQEKVEEWARDVDDKIGAQGLAMIYKEINKALKAGTINQEGAIAAIKTGSDQFLEAIGGTNRWSQFRSRVSGMVNDNIDTVPITDLFTYIQKGLEASYE